MFPRLKTYTGEGGGRFGAKAIPFGIFNPSQSFMGRVSYVPKTENIHLLEAPPRDKAW